MKLKKKLCLLLATLLALTCAACAKKGTAVPPAGSGTAADSAAASAVPAPTEPAAALIGAKTQQELVEHVAAFFRSGCDAQELLPYYDHDFFLVYYLTDDDMGNFVNSMDAALPIIASMRRGEAAFTAAYPEISRKLFEDFDVDEAEEEFSSYLDDLAYDIECGEITADDPNYEQYRAWLGDRAKGREYLFSRYPELLETCHKYGIYFSLQEALDVLTAPDYLLSVYAEFGYSEAFRDAEFSFNPEWVYDEDGLFSTKIAQVDVDGSPVSLDMVYGYRDGRYFAADLEFAVGSYGG